MSNGTSKKTEQEQKKSKDKSAAGNVSAPPAGQPAGSQPQPKKGKGCLTCGIIAAVTVVVLIIGFIGLQILGFWFSPYGLFGIFSKLTGVKNITNTSSQKGTLQGKNLSGLIDPSQTVTKRITAANGGQITVQTANGLYFTLNIGPGSLKKDTDISLTPIKESPIENYDPDDPGVIIGPDDTNLGDDSTATVSEDPPADPGDSGADPGTSGGGTTSPPIIPPGTPGGVPDLTNLTGLLGGNASMATPSGNFPDQGAATGNTGNSRNDGRANGSNAGSSRFTGTDVIIFTSYGGGVRVIPATPSDDGGSISGPIDETGATSFDDPDANESDALADNAATASGGTCSPEFLQVMANAAQSGGADSSAAQAALRDCFNVEWLNNLCVNDPVKLRRTYFQQRIALARRYDAQAASEIENLMNQCQARYHFHGEGIHPQSTAEVTMFSSIDANVCGYVDDKWTGTQVYQMRAEYNSGYDFEGTAEFNLPPGGGHFSGITHGTNSMAVGGVGVGIPNFDFGFEGSFDGYKTISYVNLYPGTVNTGIPIELEDKHCNN